MCMPRFTVRDSGEKKAICSQLKMIRRNREVPTRENLTKPTMFSDLFSLCNNQCNLGCVISLQAEEEVSKFAFEALLNTRTSPADLPVDSKKQIRCV